jgi:molecular chaperone IbpA
MQKFIPSTLLNPEALFKDADKFFVGFEDQFNRMAKLHDDVTKNIPNYPPYNIRKTGDNTYVIEVAVAGFARQDIEIEFANDTLTIRGNTSEDNNDYLFKGIANRAFTRTFAVNDQIEIKDATLFNGLLQVVLDRIIPDHKKPQKIEVKEGKAVSKSKKLTEEEKHELAEKL